jgi:hypothetical protein
MRLALICVALLPSLALSGCYAPRPEPFAKPPAAASPASPVLPFIATKDTCGLAELAWLIGKPKTEIPVPVDPSRRRVYCATCMITQDYSHERQNIVFDPDSGLVVGLSCG